MRIDFVQRGVRSEKGGVTKTSSLALFTLLSSLFAVSTVHAGGTATIQPSSIAEGAQVSTVTINFVVPAGGYTDGGGVKVQLPFGWGPYPQTTNAQNNGYVTAASDPAQTLIVTPATTEAAVNVILDSGQSLAAGTTIQVLLYRLWTGCPQPGQTAAPWTISSRSSGAGTMTPIASQPSTAIQTGPARYIGFQPWDTLTTVSGVATSTITIQGRSFCGNPAAVSSSVVIGLSGYLSDYSTIDGNAQFSATPGFGATITQTEISTGNIQTNFFYRTTTLGNYMSVRATYLDPEYGINWISRSVNVLGSAVSFSGLSIDGGTAGAGSSVFSLSPDGDGTNDFAFIRFTPSNATVQWRVLISSDNFNSIVYERWGSGPPAGTVQWDGRRQFGGTGNSIVPNGTYTVKVEVPGLISNTSLSITITGASIAGQVRMGGTGIPYAWVNAQPTSGGGYGGAMSDANGDFIIYGLKSGQAYNLNTNFYDPNTQTPFNGSRNNVTAPATGADIVFSQPAKIRVHATAPQPAEYDSYGHVSVRSTDYSRYYSGTLRITAGSTTSNNGDYFSPSSWTVLVVQPGTYNLTLELGGYGTQTENNFTLSAGQTLDITKVLVPRATVYGKVSLPTPPSNGAWVSVEGVKSGNTYPTVWGGVFLNVGQSSGIFQVFNIDAGTYDFRVRAPGYVPVVLSTAVTSTIGDSINGGLNVSSSSFSTGGVITGTITINGNTLSQGSTVYLWFSAYSQTLGSSEFTQVALPTDASSSIGVYQIGGLANGTYQVFPPYIYGFELVPPGPKTVTVSGGVGTLNMTLLENSGQISGSITLPGSNSDYSKVTISIQGPNLSTSTTASASSYAIQKLGSGHYSIVAFYETTGAQVRRSISVVNGQTTTLNLDLSAPTYSVSGQVSIQTAFTIQSSSGGAITVNTISDLLANDTTQFIFLNNVSTGIPTSRVEAFPKTFGSYGESNRSGFGNNFNIYDFKYGTIQADGTYTIPGLSPGVWEVSVYPYVDGGISPSLAAAKQILTVGNVNQTGINFALSAGNSVAGTISLPSGAVDFRHFDIRILTERGDFVQSLNLPLGSYDNPANAMDFLFKNLPNGRYVLMVVDPGTFDGALHRYIKKYVGKPIPFEIANVNVTGLNLTLAKVARIIGKISIQGKNADGTPASTLITTSNKTMLPENFSVTAAANPWVEGGYQEVTRESLAMGLGRIVIDTNNQFTIDGLVAGAYDVQFRQNTFGASVQGQGSINLASYTKGQVRVTEGQTMDIGTIELKQGLSLSGTVKDESNNPLPNIVVRAEPSNSREGNNFSETTTDSAGQFTLTGLNPDLKTYTIRAAPRPYPGDATPLSGYGEVTRRAVDVTQTPAPTLAFTLTLANASLSGSVTTSDGGALSYPEDKQQGYPAAAVYLKRQGVPSTGDDPLGEIREATNLNGTYSISNLVPGTYDIIVMSLNYKPSRFTQTLTAGSNSAAAVSLQKGSVLTATLLKPDGTGVNTSDVRFAVAATADLGSIIFGQVTSDENTRSIRSIRFSGFETSKRYSILLFDDKGNITTPTEGRNLQFSSDTEDKTLTLTFQASAPNAFTQVKKVGSAAEITFYFSRALRNSVPADDVASGLISVTSGNGTLSGAAISGDRRSFVVTYTPATGEQTATLAFASNTADINPATGSAFPIAKSVILRFGQRASAEKNINPVFGGEVSLAEADNNPSAVSLPGNALLTSTGAIADAGSNYTFSFTATEDVSDVAGISGAPGTRAAALTTQMARGAASYVSEAYMAMRAAAAASINPLSAFYSVLLPAGLSHTLNNAATLTLQYDSGTDPNTINVYFFDGTKYLLENTNRTIDTVNRTISVDVSHFSTFVVLQNDATIVTVDGGASAEAQIEVFNFPNPFDLQPKTKTLNRGGSTTSLATDGTIIRYTIPGSKAGRASLEIFDITGNKVRGIDLGAPATATYHYVAWDGKNDAGNKVASGVYMGVLKVGSEKKIWKMAVIK